MVIDIQNSLDFSYAELESRIVTRFCVYWLLSIMLFSIIKHVLTGHSSDNKFTLPRAIVGVWGNNKLSITLIPVNKRMYPFHSMMSQYKRRHNQKCHFASNNKNQLQRLMWDSKGRTYMNNAHSWNIAFSVTSDDLYPIFGMQK